MRLIKCHNTGRWGERSASHLERPSWLRRLFLNPAIGEACSAGEACTDDAAQWTVAIDIAAPTDASPACPLYKRNCYVDWLPKNRFMRTTGISGSIVVNAMRTGFTTVVASWVHSQSLYDGGGELIAFLAAFTTYAVVSVILWITIGYGGSAISSDTNIVLDAQASKTFCSKYLRDMPGMPGMPDNQSGDKSTMSFSPLISLEFDNALLAPAQNMYCVKQILCLTQGPMKIKVN